MNKKLLIKQKLKSNNDWFNTNVVIVGATGGLGHEITLAIAKRGGQILAIGRNKSKLKDLKKEILEKYQYSISTNSIQNIADPNHWKKIISKIETSFGTPDYIINASGIDVRKKIINQDEFEINNQIDTNLKGAIFLTRAFLPLLIQNGRGEILHLSGFLDGRLAFPYYSVDVASRAGVVSFAESINREIGNSNIRVATYCPTVADTEAERPFHKIWKEMGQKIVKPEEIAEECIEMLGSKNTLRISGGIVNSIFAKINSLFPGLANLIMMNQITNTLRKHLDSPTQNILKENTKKSLKVFLPWIGWILVAISFFLYGFIVLIPFLTLSLSTKAASITYLVVGGEITFWFGLIFVGKNAYQKFKSYFFIYLKIFKENFLELVCLKNKV
jgi:short-subunit dehydrogenase